MAEGPMVVCCDMDCSQRKSTGLEGSVNDLLRMESVIALQKKKLHYCKRASEAVPARIPQQAALAWVRAFEEPSIQVVWALGTVS